MRRRVKEILAVRPTPPMRTCNDPRLLFQIKSAAILHMRRVNHIGHSFNTALVGQRDLKGALYIGRRDQLTLAQICEYICLLPGPHRKGDPMAARPWHLVERQYKSWVFLCSAVMDRTHTKAAGIAFKRGNPHLIHFKARVPDQRPIAKHPHRHITCPFARLPP